MFKFLIGADRANPDFAFTTRDYRNGSISATFEVDVLGSALSVDESSVAVQYDSGAYYLFSPADYNGVLTSDGYLFAAADQLADITQIAYGTPVWIVEDGGRLVAKMYYSRIARAGKKQYRIYATSAMGLLDRDKHFGGVYAGVLAGTLIADIVGDRFTYTIDPAVSNQIVTGWLPIDTRRNNLHRLMFAYGINLVKGNDGNVIFRFILDLPPEQYIDIPDDRVFVGARLDYGEAVTAVEAKEHAYYQLAGTDEEQIFNNLDGAAADGLLVEFDNPYYGLRGDGLTIDAYGDNYAYVSGMGTLYGVPYHHETKIVRKAIDNNSLDTERIFSAGDDGLINSLNSENVVRRLYAYYANAKTVERSLKLHGEKPGDIIRFNNPLGETVSGIIVKADSVFSSFEKGSVSILQNYTPTNPGNYYANRILVTSSGTVTIPAGVTQIKVVLIGGGSGGQGGYAGENGYGEAMTNISDRPKSAGRVYAKGEQAIAKGGTGGVAGQSGQVYVAIVAVTPGDVLTFTVGAGGLGGAAGGGVGQAGAATTVSSDAISASSEDGALVNGYLDPFSGAVFAAPGANGKPGGDGGQSDTVSLFAANGADGLPGADVIGYVSSVGGRGGKGINSAVVDLDPATGWNVDFGQIRIMPSGGGGGGAAYGADGGDGSDAEFIVDAGDYHEDTAIPGNGGDGADAVAPIKPTYGCGGDGGGGGGAGGNAGGVQLYSAANMLYNGVFHFRAASGGAGGAGAAGAAGGDGCAIVYF